MTSNTTTFLPSDGADGTSKLGARISDAASQVKDKVLDVGRAAANKIDDNREAAAGGLQRAATVLHERAEDLPGGEKVTGLAHAAAEKIRCTANYVRDNDVNRIMADVAMSVKNNPGRALLVAAAAGFLVGRAFSSRHRG